MNMHQTYKIVALFLTFMSLYSGQFYGQQDAVNSQFVMNKMFVNPGYTGYKEAAIFTAMHRSQWVGFKGAPSTQVITFDTPLKKNELAAGGIFIHDKIGPTTRIGIAGDFAYRVRLTNRATLSWGAQASLDLYQMNLTDLSLTSDYFNMNDEAFMYNTKGLIVPNIGFGGYYHKKDHFLGISCPKMLRPKLEKKSSAVYGLLNGREEPTVYLMGGKQFKITKDLQILASGLIRGELNAPMSIGFYANAIYLKNFNFGTFYHFREVVGLLFQWQFDKQFKAGYSVDIPTNALLRNSWGSHELTFAYTINSNQKRIVYPRYF